MREGRHNDNSTFEASIHGTTSYSFTTRRSSQGRPLSNKHPHVSLKALAIRHFRRSSRLMYQVRQISSTISTDVQSRASQHSIQRLEFHLWATAAGRIHTFLPSRPGGNNCTAIDIPSSLHTSPLQRAALHFHPLIVCTSYTLSRAARAVYRLTSLPVENSLIYILRCKIHHSSITGWTCGAAVARLIPALGTSRRSSVQIGSGSSLLFIFCLLLGKEREIHSHFEARRELAEEARSALLLFCLRKKSFELWILAMWGVLD